MHGLMSSERDSKKRRLHIVLSLDNPRQRETWEILSQQKNKTSAVCEAVCSYHKRKNLEDTLRSFETILGGELDKYPEAAFSNVGNVDEVIAKAKKMGAV